MNVIAVCGNYRKKGVTESLLDAAVRGARDAGVSVEILTLRDIRFEYCRNCKSCWEPADRNQQVGFCVIRDDLTDWIQRIGAADGLILAAPVNFGTLTAVFKKFQERCLVFTHLKPLPGFLQRITGMSTVPVSRYKGRRRPFLCITASGAPAFLGKLVMPCAKKQFLAFGEAWYGRLTGIIWAGSSMNKGYTPPTRIVDEAQAAGARMALNR